MEKEKLNSSKLSKEYSGYLDMFLSKIISRKLLAWIVSTFFLYKQILEPDDWVYITLLWIGVQGTIDWYEIYKK